MVQRGSRVDVDDYARTGGGGGLGELVGALGYAEGTTWEEGQLKKHNEGSWA